MPKIRKAVIYDVVESDIREDKFSGKRYQYGNFVRVQDETGEIHIFTNGSLNGISPENRVEGKKGTIQYRSTPFMGLWYFKAEEE